MADYATIEDVKTLYRTLTPAEEAKATALIPIACASLREKAKQYHKDLDAMIANDADLAIVAKSVTVDVVVRDLEQSKELSQMAQFSESAMGYSISGTIANSGGGLFIKDYELKRLGINNQRYGVIDFYGNN